MPDLNAIYREQSEQYEALIAREDYQGNLPAALMKIASFSGEVVIDTGAGTGRLALLLAPLASRVHVFDLSHQMLQVALRKLTQGAFRGWTVSAADHRALPVPDRTAGVLVTGWSLSMLVVNDPDGWREQVCRALQEFERVLRPGGTAVVIETLGTGHEEPARLPELEQYFELLESAGFRMVSIRTDYRFAGLEEARALSEFFFGEALAMQVVEQNWVILPECTGVWWKTF